MTIAVVDPFGVHADAAMPQLGTALQSALVQAALDAGMPRLTGPDGSAQLSEIRVTRYKPGRRCVLEYDVRVNGRDPLTLIGKARRHRPGHHALQRQDALWQAGFDDASADGIAVPEPIGVLKPSEVWLQRKAPGAVATTLFGALAETPARALVERIAVAALKLHHASAGIEITREHTMASELDILRTRLTKLAEARPVWAARLTALLANCDALGATVPTAGLTGIHRDFYGDQVIVDGARLTLIDFDLYCLGDPAVDIGNFMAHLSEQSLRERGDPDALRPLEHVLAARYLAGIPATERPRTAHAIQVYRTLSLVRHISLSTEIVERQHLTEPLLALCEKRVAEVCAP